MKKYIKFYNNYIDKDGHVRFVEGVKYKISEEDDDVYFLICSNKNSISVPKSQDGTQYETGDIKVCK